MEPDRLFPSGPEETLGYNDAYLLYGVFYTVFRALGLDIFFSGELVNLTVRAIGYAAFYWTCRRILDLDWRWAALGALLFTISNNAYLHALHQQLLSVSFAPVIALLLHGTLTSLATPRRVPVLLWGTGLIAAYAAWLMTAFYMAWYCGLFGALFFVFWAIFSSPERRRIVVRQAWDHALPILGLCVLFALANRPFLRLYMPKATETGMHHYADILQYSPSLLDIFHVGSGNLLWGWLDGAVIRYLRPSFPAFSERTMGFPLGILAAFAGSAVWLWRQPNPNPSTPMLRALCAALLLSWGLFLHFGPFTGYSLIYGLVPGAKATRVIARYQIFLAAPLIALAMAFLASQAGRLTKGGCVVLCLFLVAEELNNRPAIQIDRPAELARLAAIPAPPAGCKSFYIAKSDPVRINPNIPSDGITRHSVDAMLLAELWHVPTINGYSSFQPPGYDLYFPDSPDYPNRIRRYAAQYQVTGLCGLDMATNRWSAWSAD